MSDPIPSSALKIAAALASRDFAIVPQFVSEELAQALGRECALGFVGGQFRPAGVGHGETFLQREDIRGDAIGWLEPLALTPHQEALWSQWEQLRLALNQELALGLWSLEAHFAVYEPGTFYRRHVDRFTDDDARVLSLVLYLNDDWTSENGGELCLYPDPGGAPVEIEPRAGTLVCFLSDRVPHEVRPTHRTRRSIAGWFRRR